MNKNRNSSFELLRILSMLLIIAYHIYYHCIYDQLTNSASIARMDNGLFNEPMFYNRLLLLAFTSPLGKIGNVIFILISGFFLVEKSSDINIIRTTKKLFSQQLFAAIVLTISSTLAFSLLTEKYIYLLNFNIINGMSWFVGYYFIIVVIGALFLNKYLTGLTRNNYLTFLAILFALTQFSWTNKLLNHLSSGLGTLVVGIFIYSLGGYLKLYKPFEKIRVFVFYLAILISFLMVFLSSYNITTVSIEKYIRDESTALFIQKMPSYYDYSFICIVVGVSIFEIFSRLKLKPNAIINFVASSTFMVYLMHDNEFAYTLWRDTDWITLLAESPVQYLSTLAKWTGLTFAGGFAAYLCYLLVCKLFNLFKVVAIKKEC